MLWCALRLPGPASSETPEPYAAALCGLATWALQFTPRVALCDEAVLMEVSASLRLFGGAIALAERVRTDATVLGAASLAWAPTALGALALARADIGGVDAAPLDERLDPLPVAALTAAVPHETTLAQLGCRTLGELRALPRGGITRRFGAELIDALDRAYGLRAEQFAWVTVPATFSAKVELMARVETAMALVFAAKRLLLQLHGWLVARNAGVTTFTLRWVHDTMRPKEVGGGDALVIRTAEPMRDVDHLSQLLAEHLARVQLAAPVECLELVVDDVRDYSPPNTSLLPDASADRESLALALERIAARLGAERVLRPARVEDARPECAQQWRPASEPARPKPARLDGLAQPTFLLPKPLRLAVRSNRPLYQGELQLLLGPHRVEGGWWHRVEVAHGTVESRQVARDYWVALSAHAGALWVFQTRLAGDETAWFLHGLFA